MYSQLTGEVNSSRVMSSLLRKWTQLPTHPYEVQALTLEVTDNFGSNGVLPWGAYGPWWLQVGLWGMMKRSKWFLVGQPTYPTVEARTIYLKIAHCNFLLSFTSVCKGLSMCSRDFQNNTKKKPNKVAQNSIAYHCIERVNRLKQWEVKSNNSLVLDDKYWC